MSEEEIHISGSSVNLPNIQETIKAKVSASEEDQIDPVKLGKLYDGMVEKFVKGGLNLKAIEAIGKYFCKDAVSLHDGHMAVSRNTHSPMERTDHGVTKSLCSSGERCSISGGPGSSASRVEAPRPLYYSEFPVPLPKYGAVRLCIVFFEKANPQLAHDCMLAAKEIAQKIPFPIHLNEPSHYHITVYMTSQPHDVKVNPFASNTIVASEQDGQDRTGQDDASIGMHGGYTQQTYMPTEDVIQREIEVMRMAAATTPAPTLQVHRILVADSGTILLCCVESSSYCSIFNLRKTLRHAFPGGPERQSTIYHASLGRIVRPQQLTEAVRVEIQRVCDRWTEQLRGLEIHAKELHYVQEEQFTTVQGPSVCLPFMD